MMPDAQRKFVFDLFDKCDDKGRVALLRFGMGQLLQDPRFLALIVGHAAIERAKALGLGTPADALADVLDDLGLMLAPATPTTPEPEAQ